MITLLAAVANSTAATSDDTLLEKETAAWQAFKAKKTDEFKKIASGQVMAVYAEGVSDMQDESAAMPKWDMKSFAIRDYKVTPHGSDTAVTTYKVTLEGPTKAKTNPVSTTPPLSGRNTTENGR